MYKKLIGAATMTILGAGLIFASGKLSPEDSAKTTEVVAEETPEVEMSDASAELLMASSENTAAPETEPASEEATEEVVVLEGAAEETTEKDATEQTQYAVANVEGSVRVRAEASTESDVVGKFYDKAVGTVLEAGDAWTKIESGNVTGYVSNDFLILGEEAQKYVEENYKYGARAGVANLNVRSAASTESEKLGTADSSVVYEVVSETEEWIEIIYTEEQHGFLSKEYASVGWDYQTALTLEEEAAIEEAKRKEAEAAQVAAATPTGTGAQTVPPVSTSAQGAALGQEIANFACQFVGNPYRYGGSSLTDGTDCSGFTMAVYANYGYSLSHASSVQMGQGTPVSLDQVIPGDIICYPGHVGLYIGGGQIVHAETEGVGITIRGINYCGSPTGARRIVQ